MTAFCELRDVQKRYNGRCVLDVEHLAFEAGQITALVGANGSGKTTLLEIASLLTRPSAGSVRLWGRDATPRDRRTVVMLMHPGFIFSGTVWSNVLYGPRATGAGRSEARRRAAEALQTVGMAAFAHRDPAGLSAGERQRVNLARAITLRPKAMLLDEPTANVDDRCARTIADVLARLRDRDGTTIVHTCPSGVGLQTITDRVVRLDRGRVIS